MSSSGRSLFPRVNFLGVVAGALALVSIVLPWWGITVEGFATTNNELWGVWGLSGDPIPGVAASSLTGVLSTYSPIILVLAIMTTVLGVIGSFTKRYRTISAGLAFAIAGLLGYAALVSYAVSQNCQSPGCISQTTGSASIFGFSISWGFQSGFYLFTAATIILLFGLAFHRPLTQRGTSTRTA